MKIATSFLLIFALAFLCFCFLLLEFGGQISDGLGRHRPSLSRDTQKVRKYAAVFTPYNIIPGGGERYLLTSIQAFQEMGYFVDILVLPENKCQDTVFLNKTITALRIDLDFSFLSVQHVVTDNRHIIKKQETKQNGSDHEYDVYFLLGNERLPESFPLGTKLNIYMNQFPFDMYRPYAQDLIETFSQFDVVFLNSMYTYDWYAKVTEKPYSDLKNQNLLGPTVKILYPPVDPFPTPKIKVADKKEVFRIIMIGRFFVGRQSKGHDRGIQIFKQLVDLNPEKSFHLTLVGNIHPEPENYAYVDKLKNQVSEWNLPVTFLNNAAPEDISVSLSQSDIYWHLTGIYQVENPGEEEDPASWEHFGIAIVEAMAAGCVPVVLDKGGPRDIVTHGVNGYLGKDSQDFLLYSLLQIKKNKKERKEMKLNAIKSANKFHVKKFIEHYQFLSAQSMQSKSLKKMILPRLNEIRKMDLQVSDSFKQIIFIVESEIDFLFEFGVRNILKELGPKWSLQVFYTPKSEFFVKSSLENIPNIKFVPLPMPVVSPKDFNRLAKHIRLDSKLASLKIVTSIPKVNRLTGRGVNAILFETDSFKQVEDIKKFLKTFINENNQTTNKAITGNNYNNNVTLVGF